MNSFESVLDGSRENIAGRGKQRRNMLMSPHDRNIAYRIIDFELVRMKNRTSGISSSLTWQGTITPGMTHSFVCSISSLSIFSSNSPNIAQCKAPLPTLLTLTDWDCLRPRPQFRPSHWRTASDENWHFTAVFPNVSRGLLLVVDLDLKRLLPAKSITKVGSSKRKEQHMIW